MLYLSCGVREELARVLVNYNVGLMLTERSYQPSYASYFKVCAIDNDCYAQGERFSLDRYLAFLKRMDLSHVALFATAPDVVGDAVATWERSAPVLPQIRALGYPAALVAQDGIERTEIDWDAFDCLFIGGTTEFKLGLIAEEVAHEAKRRSKWLHMGRVNTRARIRYAVSIGCDSVDGTMLKFGPDRNFIELCRFMGEVQTSPQLPLFRQEPA